MKLKMGVVIVDDEPLGRDGLALRLREYPNVEVLAMCANTQDAEIAITKYKPHLVFLDIEMPEETGVAFLSRLDVEEKPLVIFVTAYKSHALQAFDLDAVDYLLKPVSQDRLERALVKAHDHLLMLEKQKQQDLKSSYVNRLKIKDGETSYIVPCDDIMWIEAAGDYMCVNTLGKTHILRKTMKELVDMLDPTVFQRVHRSTILNITKVLSTTTHTNGELFVTVEGDRVFKVSRSYAARVKDLL